MASPGPTGADPRVPRRLLAALCLVAIAGAVLRFWDLGAVGLHGDEKTMALPTLSVLELGRPLMPSGMLYPRALGQVYLMAAAVRAFGRTEWALRLPSAICGVLLIPLAWLAGRRFLSPAWRVAFVAAVALLPAFIEDAQTARMYVFLVASTTAYLALLFEWERRDSAWWLAAAVLVLLLGMTFHTLAVFAAFLVFFPGLARGRVPWLIQAAVAFAAIVTGFALINAWTGRQYPATVGADAGLPLVNGPRAAAALPHPAAALLAIAAIALVLLVVRLLARPPDRAGTLASDPGLHAHPVSLAHRSLSQLAVPLLAAGLLAELDFHLHAAVWLLAAGAVLAGRSRRLSAAVAAVLLCLAIAIPATAWIYLEATRTVAPRQLLGAMLGWPSVWPLIGLGWYSVGAALLVSAGALRAAWRLAHREAVPDLYLMLALGVALPMLMIGCMRWDIPPRYAESAVMPFLLGAFGSAQWLTAALEGGARHGQRPLAMLAAAAVLLVVDPLRLHRVLDAGYARHPDHQGAARFIAAEHPGPRDIVIAEDVLQQTYYLGHVDYWLVNRAVAAAYARSVGGQWRDVYTGTPVLGTGAALRSVLARPDRGAVYVIGSGEDQEDGRRLMRGAGIAAALAAPPLRLVWRGRDGLTTVWEAPPPGPPQLAGTLPAGGS